MRVGLSLWYLSIYLFGRVSRVRTQDDDAESKWLSERVVVKARKLNN